MRHRSSCTTFAATVLLSVSACAQSTFQVSYAANLDAGDSVVNIVNTGASSGDICINVYTFQPDEQIGPAEMVRLQSNGLLSCSVRDLMSNPLTPVVGTSVVIKLVSTKLCVTPTGGTGCDPSCPILGNLIGGMVAWVTTNTCCPSDSRNSCDNLWRYGNTLHPGNAERLRNSPP